MLIHPRRTLCGIVEGQGGSVFELLPWFVVVSIAAAPKGAGQALLLGRLDLMDGVRLLIGTVANRTGGAIVAAAVAAGVLAGISVVRHRGGKRSVSFDRSLDACAYCLVPYLLLATIGAGLSALGAEVWFLPHRLLRGRGWYLTTRFLVAYGWSLLLFGILLASVWRKAPREATQP